MLVYRRVLIVSQWIIPEHSLSTSKLTSCESGEWRIIYDVFLAMDPRLHPMAIQSENMFDKTTWKSTPRQSSTGWSPRTEGLPFEKPKPQRLVKNLMWGGSWFHTNIFMIRVWVILWISTCSGWPESFNPSWAGLNMRIPLPKWVIIMNKPSDDGIYFFMNYSYLQFLGYIPKIAIS